MFAACADGATPTARRTALTTFLLPACGTGQTATAASIDAETLDSDLEDLLASIRAAYGLQPDGEPDEASRQAANPR